MKKSYICGICLLIAGLLGAQTTHLVEWSGGDGDGEWDTPGNWIPAVVPHNDADNHYIVTLGNTPADEAQNINLSNVRNITRIIMQATGSRNYTLSGSAIHFDLPGGHNVLRVNVTEDATANLEIESNMIIYWISHDFRNDSLISWLIITGRILPTSGGNERRIFPLGEGKILFNNKLPHTYRFLFLSDDNLNLYADTENNAIVEIRPNVQGTNMTISLISDLRFNGGSTPSFIRTIDFYEGAELNVRAAGGGAHDRIFNALAPLQYAATAYNAILRVVENEPGTTGRIVMRLAGTNEHHVPIITRADTIVEITNSTGTASLLYKDNIGDPANPGAMVISGAGSLLKSGAGILEIQTEQTYAGRTMITGGTIMPVESEVGGETRYGQLPTQTIAEIATGATLDLNGINQILGGLRGFTGVDGGEPATFGTVELNGATLTIDAAQTSAFAGVISGAGAVVKTGIETFTFSAGYTNMAGRILRIENGRLTVEGELKTEADGFQLAGGRITTGNLTATGATWHVTLDEPDENAIMVDVNNIATLTDATLNLALAPDYAPAIGRTYTLLRATEITDASRYCMLFQYPNGRAFEVADVWFRISLNDTLDEIILTVVPPVVPGTIIILR